MGPKVPHNMVCSVLCYLIYTYIILIVLFLPPLYIFVLTILLGLSCFPNDFFFAGLTHFPSPCQSSFGQVPNRTCPDATGTLKMLFFFFLVTCEDDKG